jgi:hypothetical protein
LGLDRHDLVSAYFTPKQPAETGGTSLGETNAGFDWTRPRFLATMPAGKTRCFSSGTVKMTPSPGRGRRQILNEVELVEAAQVVMKAHNVEGLLGYTIERQENRQNKFLGRGQGSPDQPKLEIVTIRYQMTAVARQEEAIVAL